MPPAADTKRAAALQSQSGICSEFDEPQGKSRPLSSEVEVR